MGTEVYAKRRKLHTRLFTPSGLDNPQFKRIDEKSLAARRIAPMRGRLEKKPAQHRKANQTGRWSAFFFRQSPPNKGIDWRVGLQIPGEVT